MIGFSRSEIHKKLISNCGWPKFDEAYIRRLVDGIAMVIEENNKEIERELKKQGILN